MRMVSRGFGVLGALALSVGLSACASGPAGGDVSAPSVVLRTVEDFNIRTLAVNAEPEIIRGGCPIAEADDGPEVTTLLVGAFPVEIVLQAEDRNGLMTMRLEVTDAVLVDPTAVADRGLEVARAGRTVTVTWRAEADQMRRIHAIRARVVPDPEQPALREISVRGLAVDIADRRRSSPLEDQPPIGVATVEMACPT